MLLLCQTGIITHNKITMVSIATTLHSIQSSKYKIQVVKIIWVAPCYFILRTQIFYFQINTIENVKRNNTKLDKLLIFHVWFQLSLNGAVRVEQNTIQWRPPTISTHLGRDTPCVSTWVRFIAMRFASTKLNGKLSNKMVKSICRGTKNIKKKLSQNENFVTNA